MICRLKVDSLITIPILVTNHPICLSRGSDLQKEKISHNNNDFTFWERSTVLLLMTDETCLNLALI